MPCPPDKVALTNHGGTSCVEPPPKDCPAGWRGVAGGTCMLDTCDNDKDCRDGKRCRQASICHARNEYWYGPCPPGQRGYPFLGLPAPPQPQCKQDKPTISYVSVSICGVAPCNAPSECRPGGVCALPGAKLGAPPVPSAQPAANTPNRGCGAGCAGLPMNKSRGAGGLALGLGIAWLWRRRKRARQ